MTTILGIQNSAGNTRILADSRTVAGDKPMRHHLQPKIRERSEYLLGAAGSGAACDLLLWQWQPPYYAEIISPYEHMVRLFVPSLRAALDETCPAKEGEYEFQGLVSLDGTLFLIENDLTVLLDDRGVYGLGTGGNLAVAAYLGGADPYVAMDIAIELDINSGGPVSELTQGE
jgi:ATP-dependent protease HslVU (ClpYQ) peptidase subunit